MNPSKPASKSKQSCCWYCGKSMLDNSLGLHCKEVHNKPKRVKGQTTLSFAVPSGSDQDKQENKSKSKSPPPVSDDDDRSLNLPGVDNRAENRPEKCAKTEFLEVPSSTDHTSVTTSHAVVEEKLDLILSGCQIWI